MNNLIKKILVEWSFRLDDGIINLHNPKHIIILSEVLKDMDLPTKVIMEVMSNLTEKDLVRKKQDDGSYGSAYLVKKHNPEKGQELIKKDASEEDKEKAQKTKTKKTTDKQTDKKAEKTKSTSQKIDDNRSDIFNNTVKGKGGGKTALQEEIAGISREIANKYPDDSEEEHQRKIKKYIQDNYGDTKFGKNESTIDELIKKSASGIKTMKKIKSNKGMKFDENQPKNYPKNLTFTQDGTNAVREMLEEKLKNAKTPEEKKHYEIELEYFIKHATSETGVEGDGDTAMIYQDTDGNTRIVYVSNKQGLNDPHSNATIASTAQSIRDSKMEGANEGALIDRLENSVDEAVKANKTWASNSREILDDNKEELSNAPLVDIATKLTTGRAEFVDESSREYLDKCKKNKQVIEYIKENNLDINNDEHLVQAAIAVAGTGDADEINDSNKQAPNKLLLKMTNATSSIRTKMQKLIDKGKSVEEAAEIVSKQKNPKKKPLMGGNLTKQMCLDIYNNNGLKKLEQNSQDRKDKMDNAHRKMYNGVTELDVAHYQDKEGMSADEAIKRYEEEAGPNEQTYTLSFLKRMHWDRYIDGIDDNKKMIEIGDKSYSTKDFRDCIGELMDWDGKGSLKDWVLKKMRIEPGSSKLKFVSKEGKEIHLGNDTWRTAGDLSKVAGNLGIDMQKCLDKK
jgi:hypothetical protein